MSNALNKPQPIYSTLAGDPDLREIVELFVEELPKRAAGIRQRFEAADWEGLCRLAHQLKGAAGSYGFLPITPAAARVENAVRQALSEQEICRAVEELLAMCESVRAGVPE